MTPTFLTPQPLFTPLQTLKPPTLSHPPLPQATYNAPPPPSNPPNSPRQTLRKLREQLSIAVSSQNFSQAASLRDQLAALESQLLADDESAVLIANDAFYVAFRAADLDAMRAVWLDSDAVSCAHTLAGLVVGVEEVVNSWAAMFAMGRPTHVDVREMAVNVHRNVAWVVVRQEVSALRGESTIGGVRIATNVFQKRRGRWRLVHHHASPVVTEGVEKGPAD